MLISSYYFYMSWNARYVFLIFFTTVISYCAARVLEREKSKIKRKWILLGTALLCLGVLFFFKYFNFLSESVCECLSWFAIEVHPVLLNLLLPVGISFYTFQTLSYVIDVYRGNVPAEHHFGYYATFISFFPQLVAGPIERTGNLLPQIKSEHHFEYSQATYGLKLMAWGFYKKIVIADTLAKYVSAVYDNPTQYQGFVLVIATLFFTIQVYCDFSGYSDIAIGTAKLLGINLVTNFRSPYFSQSVKEFWSRWHISLSQWFRDYVYIPLGGNRVGKVRQAFNLLATFLVSGLWHGANWTYVIWGGIHGLAQTFENVFNSKKKKESTGFVWCIRVFVVFIFASFAWIFFVSHSVGDAIYVITHMFEGLTSPLSYIQRGFLDIQMEWETLLLVGGCVFILGLYDYFSLKHDVIKIISKKKLIIRWSIYILFMLLIIFLSQKGVAAEFIYFQF